MVRKRLAWLTVCSMTCFLLFLVLVSMMLHQSAVAAGSAPLPALSAPQQLVPDPGSDGTWQPTHGSVSAQMAAISLQRSLVGPTTIEICDTVVYTLFITNTDSLTATNVIVTDTMPSGFSPTNRSVNVGQLNPGQSTNISFSFSATCNAVSGQNTATLTDAEGDIYIDRRDLLVLPSAITLRKEPAVIAAAIGDLVTWTVYIDNTGYGRVANVQVTDTLGAGLAFVSGSTDASFATIPVGETRSFTLTARIVACAGLDNLASATWGCDANDCQFQSAKASVNLLLSEPSLSFTPPAISIDYCVGTGTFSMPIDNVGAGTAHTPTIAASFAPLTVVSVSSGASYSGGAFHLPDIIGGSSYPLTFTLSLPSPACSSASQNGLLLFQPIYYDNCMNLYSFPLRTGSWNVTGAAPSLSVSKSGPDEAYAGDPLTYSVSVDSANISSAVRITDVFQANSSYQLIDADGGTVISDSSHITITWNTTQANWSRTLVFTPTGTCPAICSCCGQTVVNTIVATGVDCHNCAVQGSASRSTEIQCEKILARHAKEITPAISEACTTRTLLNTWVFPDSFVLTPTWQDMIFTDTLSHMDLVPGSVALTITNGAQVCTATFTLSSTSPLVVRNISPTCAISVQTASMQVAYRAITRDDFACTGGTFYDWSQLNVGVRGGNFWCASCDDGITNEGVWVEVVEPSLAVHISNMPATVSACGIYSPVIQLSRNSSAPAYDTFLRVPITDYAIIEVVGFAGATPALTTTDSTSYTWYYDDAFATTSSATVQLRVQRRCAAVGPLQTSVYYDNLCYDDAQYDAICSDSASATPQMLDSNPVLYKFPEVIYATGDTVTWTLTALNTGGGAAYGVTISDVLGSDLRYVSSSLTSTHGSATGVIPITSSNQVTWSNLTVLPGEKYTISFVAEIIGCTNLQNTLYGGQGCQGTVCNTCVPKISHVELPPTVMLNTNIADTSAASCSQRNILATIRNAGLLSVYTATVTENLPTGLRYVPGSTEYVTGTGSTPPDSGWVSGSEPAGAPLGPLNWSYAQIPILARLRPLQTVWIRYHVYVDCDFQGGQVSVQTFYRDVCGTPSSTSASFYAVGADRPQLSASKQGRNLTTGSPLSSLVYADPGDSVEWHLTLSNASATAAQLIIITDTLPANLSFASASPAPSFQAGQVVTWYVGSLASGSWSATLTATVNANGCTLADTSNAMLVIWGCPDTGCAQQLSAQATLRTRPVFSAPSLSTDLLPATLHQCGGVLTVTLHNDGPPAYSVSLHDTLPLGFVYSATLSSSTPATTSPSWPAASPEWTWNSLPSGDTTLAFAVVNANGPGNCMPPTSGNNTVALNYDDHNTCTGTNTYSAMSTELVTVVYPTLTLTKTPHTTVASAGQRITWTLTLQNTGTGDAVNVVITDTLGTGFSATTASVGTYPSGSNSPSIVGNNITWAPSITLAPDSTWSATVSGVADGAGAHTNSAGAVSACDIGCTAASASDTSFATLLQELGKGPSVQTGTVGSTIVHTITLSLTGADALYAGTQLSDTLPSGLGYLGSFITVTTDLDSSTGGPYVSAVSTPTSAPVLGQPGNVLWNLGDLQGVVQVDGVITSVLRNVAGVVINGSQYTNTASLSYNDVGQYYTHNTTARTDVLEPNVQLSKAVTSSTGSTSNLNGNSLLTYTLMLTNTGTSPAYDVTVTDTMPSVLVPTWIGSGGISSTVGGFTTITWTLPSLALTPPAAATRLTYTVGLVSAPTGAALTNRVTTTYSSLAGNPYPEQERTYTSTTQSTVNTAPVATVKTVSPVSTTANRLRLGDVVTYTITNTVPAGLVAYWPYQWDHMASGLHYVPGSFQLSGSLGSALDATPAHYTNVSYSHIQGNNPTGANPNIGTYKTTTSEEAIEWWMATFANGTAASQTVVVSFAAQFTGLDRASAVVDVPAAGLTRANAEELRWDTANSGLYVETGSTSQTSSVSSYLGRPTLAIVKNNTPSDGTIVGSGSALTYYLVATNSTQTPAYDFVISDTLPTGIVYQGYILSSSSGSGPPAVVVAPTVGATGVITWQLDMLNGTQVTPAGSKAVTLTVSAVVSPEVGAGTTLTNIAVIPYYDSQSGTGPQVGLSPTQRSYIGGSDTAVFYTPTPALLKAVSTVTATIGQQYIYTVTLPSPTITATLYSITVTDAVDARLSVNAASILGGVGGSAVVVGNTVTGTWTSIDPGTQAQLLITATVRNIVGTGAGQSIPNTASLSYRDGNGVLRGPIASNIVNTTVVEPDVTISKFVTPVPAAPLATITYTLAFTNVAGANVSPAYDLVISDILPSGLTYLAPAPGTPTPISISGSGPTIITWTVSALEPGAALTYQFTAQVNASVPRAVNMTNVAEVAASSLLGILPGERSGANSPSNARYHESSSASEYYGGQIGDTVWFDRNGNAMQDAGEVGLSSVIITLTSSSSLVLTATTDSTGHYSFDNLPLNVTYTTTVGLSSLPSGTTLTTPATHSSTLTFAAPVDLAYDFGVRGSGSLGDTVWFDYNANGTQQAGEHGLPGVTVRLIDSFGGSYSAVTDASGHYLFSGLLLNQTYTTTLDQATLPPSTMLTMPLSFTSALTQANPNVLTHDHGVYGPGTLGDTVWFDYNGNAAQNAGEPGIPGAVVTMTDTYGSTQTTTTDASGHYLFVNLLLNTTYTTTLDLTSLPPGTALTTSGSHTGTLITGAPNDLTHDYGVNNSGQIGDTVFFDYNDDGVQQPGEPGIAGSVITITDQYGGVQTATTDATGHYQFGSLLLNTTYTTTISTASLPASSTLTTSGSYTSALTQATPTNLTHDYGVHGPGSLGDTVWLDYNGNGVQDAGEPGVPGVVIRLADGRGGAQTATSDVSGVYRFDSLLLNTIYTTTVDLSTTPPDTHLTTAGTFSSTLTPDGPVVWSHDYGLYFSPASVPLAKLVAPGIATIGQQVIFHITVPSPYITATVFSVILSDSIDARLQVTAAQAIGGVGATANITGQQVMATWTSIPALTSAQVIITATVRNVAGNVAGTLIPNVASFTWTDNTGSTHGPQSSNTVNVNVVEPQLAVAKAVETARLPVGASDVLTYELALSNLGGAHNSTAYDLVVSDTLPGGLSYLGGVGSTPAPSISGQCLTWNVSSLDPGVTLFYTFTAQISASIGPDAVIDNPLNLSGSSLPGDVAGERTAANAPDDDTRYNQNAHRAVTTNEPLLALTKSTAPDTVTLAQPVYYTLTVSNDGPINATGVVVTDTLPTEIVFSNATTPHNGPGSTGVLTWSLGTLVPGESRTLTVTARVTDSIVPGTPIINLAAAWDDYGERRTAQTMQDSVGSSQLDGVKNSSAAKVVPGQVFTFTIYLTNTGTQAFPTLRVTDTLPSAVEYYDHATVNGVPREPDSIAGQQIVWNNLGTLHAAPFTPNSVVISYQVRVVSNVTGVYSNTVQVLGIDLQNIPSSINDSRDFDLQASDVSITKSVDPSVVHSGGVLTYTLNYYSAGPGLGTDVYITDTLPDGVQYGAQISAPSGWSAPSVVGQTINWYTPTLGANEGGAIVITASINPLLPISADWLLNNTAVITASGDITPSNNAASATSAEQGLTLSVNRPDGGGRVVVGHNFWYRICVTNTSSMPATGVVITDVLPEGLFNIDAAFGGGVYDGAHTVTWALGTLGPGWHTCVEVRVQAHSQMAGQYITNIASTDSDQAAPPASITDVTQVMPSSSAATSTPAPSATPTPTASPTTYADLTLSGHVYDAALGTDHGIANATVRINLDVPRSFSTFSEADGSYQLLVPAMYVGHIQSVSISADGYALLAQSITSDELRQQPVHDWGLTSLATPTPAASPTTIPVGTLTLTGHVYAQETQAALAGHRSLVATNQPIAGADVSIASCLGTRFATTTQADGSFSLILPDLYVNLCAEVTFEVSAPDCALWSQVIRISDLRANPMRDVTLSRVAEPTSTLTPTPNASETPTSTPTVVSPQNVRTLYLPIIRK